MNEWHCHIGGKQYGPIPEETLRQWIQEGRVNAQDLVWRQGMVNWAPAGTLAELFPTGSPPPIPTTTSRKPHRAGAVLALGILGIVPCFICGVIAWAMANNDLRDMDAGLMDTSGRGMTQAGKICGMIGFFLGLAHFVFMVLYLIFFAAVAVPHMHR